VNENRTISTIWLAVILTGHLLLAVGYSAWNPLGEAPDEADHWAYIVYLATEQRLPVGPKVTQSKHPPFYHVGAALFATLAEPTNPLLRSNPDVEFVPRPDWSPNFFIHGPEEQWPGEGGIRAFYFARLWSVLLSTLTVAASYGLARLAFPKQRVLALTTAAVLGFVPEFLFIGAAINNDNAAAFFGTLALWGAFAHFRNGGHFRPGWWTPLALGLGLLSKTSTLVLWPVVGLAILLGSVNEITSTTAPRALFSAIIARRRIWLQSCLLVFLPALLIASPWLIRNWQLYGDPLGLVLTRQTIDLRITPWRWVDTSWLIQGWFRSFWGKFGGAGHIPMATGIYWLLLLLTLVSGAGLARIGIATRERTQRGSILLLGLTILATMAGIWQYSLTALGTDQGRLLYPAVAAIVLLWVAGLLAWLPPRQQGKGGVALALAFFCFALYGYFGVIRPTFAPPQPIRAPLPIAQQAPVQWEELLLMGWQLDGEPVLYWRAEMAPQEDWRVVLRVVASDGTLVWEWRRSPAAGRWRTDRWPANVIVRDRYQIRWPDWAAPGVYHVEVGLQPFGQDFVQPVGDGFTTNETDTPFIYLGELTR